MITGPARNPVRAARRQTKLREKLGRPRLIPLSVLLEFIRHDHRSSHVRPVEALQGDSGSTG